MKTGTRLWTVVAIVCGVWLVAGGCGDDGGSSDPADVGVDGSMEPDTTGDVEMCSGDEACGDGQICEDNVCVEGCRETADCGDGQVCNDMDRCVESQAQCTSPGDPCDPDGEEDIGQGFQCVDTTGDGQAECLTNCSPTEQNPDAGCPDESICLPIRNESGAPTACYPSNCEGPTDDASCDGLQEHPIFGSYDNGGSCSRLRNNTQYCLPSGSQSVGESCSENSPVLCDPDEETCNACESGARCLGGICRDVCGSGSDCSDTGCVGTDTNGIIGVDAGFCADSCEPFSRGQCDEGDGCRVLTTEVGYCGPAGDKGFMESCSPPSDANPDQQECAEGMNCVVYQAGDDGSPEIARCTPICNAPGENDTSPRDNHATCGGEAFVRFAYVGSQPPAVDIYIDGLREFDDIATDSVSDSDAGVPGSQYTRFDPGETRIQVVDGSASNNNSPLEDIPPIFVGGESTTWVAAPDGQGSVEMYMIDDPRGVAQPASDLAKVRAVHTVPDLTDNSGSDIPVDVVVVGVDGDPGGANATELGGSLQSGDAGAFETLSADPVDVYVFQTGASRMTGNEAAVFEDVSLAGGSRTSLYLRGTVDDTDAEPLGLAKIDHVNPPDAPEMQCLNATGGSTGLCFQDCEYEDFGNDSCFSDQNACRPFFDSTGHCLPHGEADGTVRTVGESCDPTDWGPCEEGSFCRRYGDGSGVCTSYCVGGGAFDALTCDSPKVCAAEEDSLGPCETECTPNQNYGDTSTCPNFLQSCVPSNINDDTGDVEGAYCSASGNQTEGQTCGGTGGSSVLQNCEPGTVCGYPAGTADSPFDGFVSRRSGENAPDPTCRPTCDPFADGGSSCPSGEACAVNLVTNTSAEVGVCLTEADVSSKATGASCSEDQLGQACGDGSLCATSGGQTVCLEFCDWETQTGCTGSTSCELPAGGSPIGGVLGLCQ